VSTPAILDTSIFVAIEQTRPLSRPLPDQVGVSVVSLAELELGVLMAKDGESRATRLATLTRVREQTAGLPADERVASAYARLAAAELQAGRKPRVHDTWIAATALAHGGEVWTQDKDFTNFGAVRIVRL
jgi:predicted nucleic acid-binding protein